MIVLKLLTCDGTWLWTLGVVVWLVKRPLEGAKWYQ